MFNRHLLRLLVVLAVPLIALVVMLPAFSGHQSASAGGYNIAVLDWYLAHEHTLLDEDSNVVPSGPNLAPLDWYFAHDHAVLDGDNNVISSGPNLAPLDWYFAHDHAVLDGDNNVISQPTQR